MIDKLISLVKDKDAAEIFKKGGVSLIFRVVGQITGFFMTFYIAHFFGAKGLGNFVLALIILRIFSLIAKLGLDTASIRFIAGFIKKNKFISIKIFRRKVLRLLLATSILCSLLMYFMSNIFSSLLDVNAEYLQLASFFILPLNFFVLHYQSLRGLKKIAEFTFFYRVSQALFTIVSLFIISSFVVNNNVPIYAYLTSICITSLLSYISFNYQFSNLCKLENDENIEESSFLSILKISIPLMFAQSVQFIMAWTDKLMIGNMIDAENVAVYSVAFRFSMIVSITLMAVNSIAAPKFAEKFSVKDFLGISKIAQYSSKLIFISSLPIAIILLFFADFFMGLYGSDFKSNMAIISLQILVFGRMINAICGSVGNLMQMSGLQNNFMQILFLGALVNVSLNFVLIPEDNFLSKYGIEGIVGAAFASFCSLSFWNLSMVYIVKRKFGFFTLYIPNFLRKYEK